MSEETPITTDEGKELDATVVRPSDGYPRNLEAEMEQIKKANHDAGIKPTEDARVRALQVEQAAAQGQKLVATPDQVSAPSAPRVGDDTDHQTDDGPNAVVEPVLVEGELVGKGDAEGHAAAHGDDTPIEPGQDADQ